MKRKQKHLLLGVSVISTMIVINVIGLYLWREKKPEVIRSAAPEVQMLLVRVCARCGHTEEHFDRLTEAKLKMIGQSYQGWSIEGKEGNVLILKRTEEGLCSVCQKEQFFGIAKEKVVIYYGRPNRPGPVKEITSIPYDRLPEQEREDLSRGIIIRNSREKLQLLEGLSSLQDE
ncbi:MAG TPA: BofC C-terminal domain-containing protein [Bacillota bacterium]|nr:BofC C-terminal domain-containing protein [Bacillota bacterium]